MWEALAGLFAVILAVFAYIAKRNDKKALRKKEIKDNVESGDVSRIHSTIDRLRRK